MSINCIYYKNNSAELLHTGPLFKQLNILSVFNLNKYQTCIFIFKKYIFQPHQFSLPYKAFFFSLTVMYINSIQDRLIGYILQSSSVDSL